MLIDAPLFALPGGKKSTMRNLLERPDPKCVECGNQPYWRLRRTDEDGGETIVYLCDSCFADETSTHVDSLPDAPHIA